MGRATRHRFYAGGMSSSVQLPDELASRLAAEASRRAQSVDDLAAELLAAQLPVEDPLESFIGSGSSGRTQPFDIHRAREESDFRAVRPRHPTAFELLPREAHSAVP